MIIIKNNIMSHRSNGSAGANPRPAMGYATFDDGKEYCWILSVDGDNYIFSGERTIFAGTAQAYTRDYSFRSPKRAEALVKHLG